MPLTPATYLDKMIQEYAQQPAPIPLPPPRQYMTPGMQGFEMDMNGLPARKEEVPQEESPSLPTPSQVAQQAILPAQMSRRDDMNRRLK